MLFTFVSWSCSGPSSQDNRSKQSPTKTSNDLPLMRVTKLDGSQVDINALKGKTILILFQPECDHCQREAKQIRAHINSFNDYSIYFISAGQLSAIEKFGNESALLNRSNIHFAVTTVENVLNNFGPVPTPSMYIYRAQQLVRKFNGEVAIEKILQAI